MIIGFTKIGEKFLLTIGIFILVLLSFQYPFSVTVPIGGDAPSHVSTATSLQKIVSSPYPLSSALFAATRIIPATWLMRFNIFMAAGYALSGILLFLVIRKMTNTLTAIIGLIFWAISTWDVLPFYRDGTMAQLWSIPYLLLLFYAILTKRKLLFFLMLVCVYFAHPATFAIVALALTLTVPYYFLRNTKNSTLFAIIATSIISCTIVSIFLFFPTYLPYASTNEYVRYLSLRDFLESRIGILFFVAPIGLTVFLANKNFGVGKIFIFSFTVLSFFATFNSLLGIGAWERRFAPYFIISLILFGSIGLSNILDKTFNYKFVQSLIIFLLSVTLAYNAWFSGDGYYRIYRGERASLHDSELVAYEWINKTLPKNATIIQSNSRGRGVEWLPVYAKRDNFILEYRKKLPLLSSCAEILDDLPKTELENPFVLFYTWTKQPPKSYGNNPTIFPLVYKNPEVEIYQLPASSQITPNIISQCQ
jgi:hypothetical protein